MLGYVDEVNVELEVTVVEVVVGAAPKTSVLLAMLVKGSKLLRPDSVPSRKLDVTGGREGKEEMVVVGVGGW